MIILIPSCHLQCPPVAPLFLKISLEVAFNSYPLIRLLGYFLKTAASFIFPALTAIFILSISSSILPDLSKTAKVSPLHKDGSLFDRSNYRLISVVAVVSKILERHVQQAFYYFLSQRELLLDSQFGFRSSR